MKIPETYSEDEGDLEAFVIAAKTEDLVAACKLLFIHGGDLEWTNYTRGQYLVDIAPGEGFDEEFREAVQMTNARAELALQRLVQRFVPTLMEIVAQLPADEGARRMHMIDGMVKRVEAAKLEHRFLPLMLAELPALSELLAQWLLSASTATGKRVIGAAGMADEEYAHFLYCLQRIKVLMGPVVRLAYPAEGSMPEISFASEGLVTTGIDDDAHEVSIYQVIPRLERHKQGEDAALPLFIAHYLNRHAPLPEKQAYASARYGDVSTPEYDVLVPNLEIGFEVKLYSSAATQTDDKLEQKLSRLAKQLEGYAVRAGAKVIYFVTNLSKEQANQLLQAALALATNLPETTRVIPVSGIDELLAVLRTTIMDLEQALERRFVQALAPRPAPETPSPAPSGPSGAPGPGS